MRQFVLGRTRVIFGDNCAACHQSGGQGVLSKNDPDKSFPNLTDDDWLFGGWTDKIIEVITDGRQQEMPAKGGNEDLTSADIDKLADFIKNGLSTGAAVLNDDGELTKGADKFAAANELFQETCAACHGANAKGSNLNGDYDTGAVNFTDTIWRFGGDLATIKETITNGRQSEMPAWGGRLDPTTIKMLAVRVHEFGGGQPKPADE